VLARGQEGGDGAGGRRCPAASAAAGAPAPLSLDMSDARGPAGLVPWRHSTFVSPTAVLLPASAAGLPRRWLQPPLASPRSRPRGR
jgi:hypothetical protein